MQKKILLIKQTVLSDCGFVNSFPEYFFIFYKKSFKKFVDKCKTSQISTVTEPFNSKVLWIVNFIFKKGTNIHIKYLSQYKCYKNSHKEICITIRSLIMLTFDNTVLRRKL